MRSNGCFSAAFFAVVSIAAPACVPEAIAQTPPADSTHFIAGRSVQCPHGGSTRDGFMCVTREEGERLSRDGMRRSSARAPGQTPAAHGAFGCANHITVMSGGGHSMPQPIELPLADAITRTDRGRGHAHCCYATRGECGNPAG